MGRKIPGARHKGVKDPDKQRRERFNVIKQKINAPPSNPDDQDIPKSLARIMNLREKIKDGTISLKRKRKHKKQGPIVVHSNSLKPSEGKPEKMTPIFKQGVNESDRRFLYRVKKICHNVMKESAFEDKFGVDVVRNRETGDVDKVIKKPKDEIDELMKNAKKKGKKKKDSGKPRLTKAQKWQNKLQEKKNKKQRNNFDEFASYKDEVQFGEVVHAPPMLTAPRKVKASTEVSRPGKKDLLLKSLLGSKANVPKGKTANKIINKKGKRKDLPNALRRQLDQQQSEIISAYKNLKAQKRKE